MADTKSIKAILSAQDQGFTSTMNKALSSVARLGKSVAKGVGFGSMMAIGQKAVSAVGNGVRSLVSDMDKTNAAWTTFGSNMKAAGHSSGEIKKAAADMKDFASKSIYYSSDMASTYAQLDAVGTKNTANLVKGFGAVASAAENPTQAMKSMSQQATQMAAKPKVAWQDFKIMMEQTPAGISQVAKQMGMSTKQLVSQVQEGGVKTKDFFSAISKIGGDANHQLMKNATHYKTIGEAISGTSGFLMTKMAPAWKLVSKTAISALGGIQGKIAKLDPKEIKAKVSAGIDKAKEIFNEAKPIIQAFGSTIMRTGKVVVAALPYLAKIAPVLAPALAIFKGFQKVKGIASAIQGVVGGFGAVSRVAARMGTDSNNAAAALRVLQDGSIKASGAASSATGRFGGLKGALGALASPAGIATGAILGISAAAYAWHKHMEGIPGTSQNLAANLRTVASTARETSQSFDELKQAQKEQSAQGLAEMAYTQKLKNELDGLVSKNGEVKKGYESRAKFLVRALSESTGVEMKYTNGIVQGYAKAESAIDKYIAKKRALILLESNEGAYKKAMKGQIDSEKAMQKAQETEDKIVAKKEENGGRISQRDQATLRRAQATQQQAIADNQKYAATIEQQEAAMAAIQEGHYKKAEQILAGHYNAKNALRSQQQAQQKAADKQEMADMQAKNAQIAEQMKAGMGVEAAVNQLVAKAKASGIKVPKAVANGIKSGRYQLPTSVEGMNRLVQFNALERKAKNAGKSVPAKVKAGIMSGKMAVPTSVNQMNALVKYTKLVTKAKNAGVSVPKNVKAGIASGKMKPTEAVKIMNDAIEKKMTEGSKKVGKSGKKTGDEVSKGVKSGSSKAVSAAGSMADKVNSKLKAGASKAAEAGRMISTGFAQGMSAAASAAEAAAERIVAACQRAAEAKAKIGSPSKLFAKIGRFVVEGFAKGMNDNVGTAAKAAKKMVGKSSKIVKFDPKQIAKNMTKGFKAWLPSAKAFLKDSAKDLKNAVKKWTFIELGTDNVSFKDVGDAVYKEFESQLDVSMDKKSWKATGNIIKSANKKAATYTKKSTKAATQAAAARKKANKYENLASKAKKNSNKKKYNELAKKYNKIANARTKRADKNRSYADQVKSARDLMVSQYESAYNDMTDKAKQAAQEQIDAINEKYDQLYQELKQKRDNFYGNLTRYDSLFTEKDTEAVDSLTDSYGFLIKGATQAAKSIQLTDFSKQTADIKAYAANLNKLKAWGVSAQYLEEATQNLSAADGLKLTNQLLAEGPEKAKAYGKSFDEMTKAADELASKWYKSDFDQIQSQYDAAINKIETDLNNKLKGIAKNTMEGFVTQLNREISRGNLGKAGEKAANQIVKALKKKLGIHSPSKVTAAIGMYTGKGMVKGLERSESMINKAMDNIVQIPTVRMPEMRSAVGAELSSDYSYGASIDGEIVVVTTLDGKVVAETTAPLTEEILNRRQRRENRRYGRL